MVRLREPADAAIAAVEALDFVERVDVQDGELLLALDDPKRHNPEIVRTIVSAGGEIEYIREKERGLEDVYLRLVGEGA